MAVYPSGIKNWTNKIDGVDYLLAADINEAYTEITAIETDLGTQLADIVHYINVTKLPSEYTSAIGDGIADDTQAFNDAISYALLTGNKRVFVPDGTYMIDAVFDVNNLTEFGNIYIPSGFEVCLSKNAILQVITNDACMYAVFSLKNVDDVYIHGGQIVGDRDTHNYNPVINPTPTHETGHGIYTRNCTNLIIRDIKISDCTGDGIYIGSVWNSPLASVKNILLDNVTIDNVRRNGLSICHGTNIKIVNCTLINVNGTAPQSGIDIEGEGQDVIDTNIYVSDVSIENCYFKNNFLTGIQTLNCNNVNINNCTFSNQVTAVLQYSGVNNMIISNCNIFHDTSGTGLNLVSDSTSIIGNIITNGDINIGALNEITRVINNMLIKGNVIVNGGITFQTEVNCINLIIDGNIINNSTDTSIVAGFNGVVNNLIITNNTIFKSLSMGINLKGSNCVIQNNRIIQSKNQAIYLYENSINNSIKGNYIKDWGSGASAITTGIDSGTNCKGSTISDNVIELSDSIVGLIDGGILIIGDYVYISNNRVITGDTKKCVYGIGLVGDKGAVINNDVRDSYSSTSLALTGEIQQVSRNYTNLTILNINVWVATGTLITGVGITVSSAFVGAKFGDFILISAPYALQGVTVSSYVSAVDTIEIRIENNTGASITLADAVWKAKVLEY